MVIGILRKVRNEYGKAIRKDYENHKITEKRANMTEYEIQRDGVTHTLTGVTKDNWLVDKVGIRQAVKQGFIECRVGGIRWIIPQLGIKKRTSARRRRYFTNINKFKHGYMSYRKGARCGNRSKICNTKTDTNGMWPTYEFY